MTHNPATYDLAGAVGPDTRWYRDSSCAKYMRNPGAPVAFALVTALMGRVCDTFPYKLSRAHLWRARPDDPGRKQRGSGASSREGMSGQSDPP